MGVPGFLHWVWKKGSFGKGVFSERSIFENFLETLEILENLQTVKNKRESDHLLEILENLDSVLVSKDSSSERPLS